jgi:hypothetical protein
MGWKCGFYPPWIPTHVIHQNTKHCWGDCGSFGATWEVPHVLHQKGGMLDFLCAYSNLVILIEIIPF